MDICYYQTGIGLSTIIDRVKTPVIDQVRLLGQHPGMVYFTGLWIGQVYF
jgi:hypothetical protein